MLYIARVVMSTVKYIYYTLLTFWEIRHVVAIIALISKFLSFSRSCAGMWIRKIGRHSPTSSKKSRKCCSQSKRTELWICSVKYKKLPEFTALLIFNLYICFSFLYNNVKKFPHNARQGNLATNWLIYRCWMMFCL